MRSALFTNAASFSKISGSEAQTRLEVSENGRAPRKYSFYIATLFFCGAIVFAATSHVLAVGVDKVGQISTSIFDPSCNNKLGDGTEQKFSLDMTLGNFTFAQAKMIDVSWDIVVGQGGRVLHGWVLYQYIVRLLLVVAMERSTVTYNYYTTLSFCRVSSRTLWQTLKTFSAMKSWTVLFCTTILIYPIIYTLLFAVIWGAATGYVSHSRRLYPMPDGNMLPLNTDELSLCWVLDSERLGMSPGHIEIGPSFASLEPLRQPIKYTDTELCIGQLEPFENTSYTMVYTSGGWRPSTTNTIWDHFNLKDVANSVTDTSENFQNIRAYALSTQLLQIIMDPNQWLLDGPQTSLMSAGQSLRLDQWEGIRHSCLAASLTNGTFVDSLQYAGAATPDPSHGTPHFAPYNEAGFEKTYEARFVFNSSTVEWNNTVFGVMPFNSTIRLDGRVIELPSPLLDVGFGCSGDSAFGSLGNCVCYREQPVELDIFSDDRAICDTAPGYVWGFSRYLTRWGLALEAAWMACCLVAYLCLSLRSRLAVKSPIGDAGTMRLLIDVAEAACNDLGSDALRLSEKELQRELAGIRIGYQTDESEPAKGLHYRLVSGLRDPGRIERLDGSAVGLKLMQPDECSDSSKWAR